jgi:hypothetical protein
MLEVLRFRQAAKVAGTAAIAALTAMALFRTERPVLFRLNPDIGAVRPRSYCVLNPFRERGPEHAGEAVLDLLRQGKRDVLVALVDAGARDRILMREEQYRIESWRLCWRTDDSEGTALGYWVRRAGYNGEEEVFLNVVKARGWTVSSYSAIY